MVLKKRITTKKILYKKFWLSGSVQIHVESPPTPLVKNDIETNTAIYYVKIKLGLNPMTEAYAIYEIKMAPFGYCDI